MSFRLRCVRVGLFSDEFPGDAESIHSKRNWPASNIRKVQSEVRRPVTLLVQCQQCSDAPCVRTCPFGANYYDENGLVRTDPNKCVGCNYCIASCPYDARWSHPDSGLPMKCIGEGCMKLIENGEQPACVKACPAGAERLATSMIRIH